MKNTSMVSTLVVLAVIAVAVGFAIKRIKKKGACNCGHESDCGCACSSCDSKSNKN
ncbi:hypothetical protein [Peptostreptococcus sp. MV1]|uniref:hypothetical protein n=1 Tax=Peptostreptococcus sp. MV1 TaxID=1219626 RepID=UPI000AD3E283|nr:hypothetical protein [Peptostreptococcus sp. MV1]